MFDRRFTAIMFSTVGFIGCYGPALPARAAESSQPPEALLRILDDEGAAWAGGTPRRNVPIQPKFVDQSVRAFTAASGH